jgi:hypothetical protein
MSVYRVRKNKNYSIIHNGFLRSTKISLKAKGLLAFLLSLPDDWQIHVMDLINRCKEGEAAVRSGLKELEKAGYIVKIQIRNENDNKFKGVEYDVHEVPTKSQCEPRGDFPHAENPNAENRGLLKTNRLKTNITKKEMRENIIDYIREKFRPHYQYSKYSLKAAMRVKTKNIDPDYIKWTIDNLSEKIPDLEDPPSYINTVLEDTQNAARYEEQKHTVQKQIEKNVGKELEDAFQNIKTVG